ncbi:hypothetical protein Dxin01_03627 [Deinococcus xinjiangensis]|uniref:Parallel beta-helix repeat (Two copies) n=1 Tax=Deinococcus xinjiangensis TaxID=457454 RepID=A0ABP9VH01_9DEIO
MTDLNPSPGRIGDRYQILETVESSPYEWWHRAVSDWGQNVLINEFCAPHQGSPTGNRIRQNFSRYARLLAQIQHPSVIRTQDLLIDEPKQQYVVFEQPPQTTLRAVSQRQPGDDLFRKVESLLEGLAASHSLALLHTRITPEHIRETPDGRLLLTHFGLAHRALADERETVPTDPRYAAPELLHSGRYSPQTDLYALAASLLESFSGTTLPPATARQQGVPLPKLPPHVPSAVVATLHECLQLNPAGRAVSASEALELLHRTPSAPVAPAPEPVAAPVPAEAISAPLPPPSAPDSRQTPPSSRARTAPTLVLGLLSVIGLAGAMLFLKKPAVDSAPPTATAPQDAAPQNMTDPQATQAASASPPSVPEVLRVEVVSTTELNIRDSASTTGKVITTLKRGENIDVVQDQGEWLKIRSASGVEGWVSSNLTLPLRSQEDADALVSRIREGGDVQVERGAYLITTPLVLETSVNLSGAGMKQTLLFSQTSEDTIISRNINATLEDLSIAHIGGVPARALLQEGGNLHLNRVSLAGAVRNDDTSEYGSGLWVKDAGQAEIQNSLFTANAYGVYVSDSSVVNIAKSTFIGNRDGGLLMKDGSSGEIQGSNFETSGAHGIHLMGQTDATVSNNSIHHNRGRGITIFGQARPHISENTIEENVLQGIGVQGEATPTLTGNTIQGNQQSGITYFDNSGGSASKNTVQANRTAGIRVTEYAAPALKENAVVRNRENGIGYSENAGGTAVNNQITGNDKPGIATWGDAAPTVTGNTVTDNHQSGIVIAERSRGVFSENEITGNDLYGLIVTGEAQPEINGNTVSGNVQGGIFYKQMAGGSGYGNTCMNNGGNNLKADLTPGNPGPDFRLDYCKEY